MLNQKIKNKTVVVAILGLGHVGYPMSSLFAKNGFQTIGYDINSKRLEDIANGRIISELTSLLPSDESKRQIVLSEITKNLNLSNEEKVLKNADVFIVDVPTPLKENETGFTRLLKNPYLFATLHVYPLLVALFYPPGDWLFGLVWYVALLISTVIVWRVPLYLQRPTAFFIITLAIIGNLYFIEPVRGFEWLVPLLFIKIIYGHLVREEPYRPMETEV